MNVVSYNIHKHTYCQGAGEAGPTLTEAPTAPEAPHKTARSKSALLMVAGRASDHVQRRAETGPRHGRGPTSGSRAGFRALVFFSSPNFRDGR